MARVMASAAPGTVLPKASWTATCTDGVRLTPATVERGWAAKDSPTAPAGVMLKDALVAPVRPVALAVTV